MFARLIKAEDWKKDLRDNAWVEDYSGANETRRRLDAEYEQLADRLTELGLLVARPAR